MRAGSDPHKPLLHLEPVRIHRRSQLSTGMGVLAMTLGALVLMTVALSG
jgi:hypothetical protein